CRRRRAGRCRSETLRVCGITKGDSMPASTPDWMSQRGAALRESKDRHSWLVYLGKEPQYLLLAVPVRGKYGCRISQTVNGKRRDGPDGCQTSDEALRGGLDQLRKALGW